MRGLVPHFLNLKPYTRNGRAVPDFRGRACELTHKVGIAAVALRSRVYSQHLHRTSRNIHLLCVCVCVCMCVWGGGEGGGDCFTRKLNGGKGTAANEGHSWNPAPHTTARQDGHDRPHDMRAKGGATHWTANRAPTHSRPPSQKHPTPLASGETRPAVCACVYTMRDA